MQPGPRRLHQLLTVMTMTVFHLAEGHMKHLFIITALSLAVGSAHAADLSAPSQALGDGSALVVGGSLLSVAAAGSVVVGSAHLVAGGIELVLEGAGAASTVTVRLSGAAARGLSIAAGTTLEVAALSTGHALVLSGKVLAFIPNEAGKALLHHARAA
jgi:hypothetical protein